MVGFLILGIVILVWVLTWDAGDPRSA